MQPALIAASLAPLFLCLASGCTGARSADDWDSYDAELIDVVSFETGCPRQQIHVTDRPTDPATGTYQVEACGADLSYVRADSVFQAENREL